MALIEIRFILEDGIPAGFEALQLSAVKGASIIRRDNAYYVMRYLDAGGCVVFQRCSAPLALDTPPNAD